MVKIVAHNHPKWRQVKGLPLQGLWNNKRSHHMKCQYTSLYAHLPRLYSIHCMTMNLSSPCQWTLVRSLHRLDGITLPGANARASSSPSCLLLCGTTEKSLKSTTHQECSFYWTRTTRKQLHIFVWQSIIPHSLLAVVEAELNQAWLVLQLQHLWWYPAHFL